jgi:SPP1 gp7 family putative phage head morphogenesis protein
MRDIVKEGYLNGTPTMKRDYVIERKLSDGTVNKVTLHSKQPTIAEQIQTEYGVSKNRAQLIARDQIAKLNSQITQMQQVDAGIKEYVWRSMKDSRTRACHRELDGKRFSWNNPPEQWYELENGIKKYTGQTANPGEYFQCRCAALAVFEIEGVTLPWEKEAKDDK